jgi:iron complex outermembrane receptor protein
LVTDLLKERCNQTVDQLNSKNFDNVAAINADLLKRCGGTSYDQSGEPGAEQVSVFVVTLLYVQEMDHLSLLMGTTRRWSVSTGSDIGLGGSSARNPLNFINQNDIESLTVLKDASSTAIYGSRGANGVIVTLLKIKIKRDTVNVL